LAWETRATTDLHKTAIGASVRALHTDIAVTLLECHGQKDTGVNARAAGNALKSALETGHIASRVAIRGHTALVGAEDGVEGVPRGLGRESAGRTRNQSSALASDEGVLRRRSGEDAGDGSKAEYNGGKSVHFGGELIQK
jgi:hypothetical protein